MTPNQEELQKIRAQVSEQCAALVAETRDVGLRHGRVSLETPSNRTAFGFLAWLDCLRDAGCSIVSITEHVVPPRVQIQGAVPLLMVNVVFRLPEALQ